MRNPDQVLTAAEMRAAEDDVIAEGVTVDELMLRAGRGAADWVWRIAAGRPVTVLCGPGNNGGDGYVIAETLRERGLAVEVIAPTEPSTLAARNARNAWQGSVATQATTAHGGVFVDCLFGSGLTRPLACEQEEMLARLVESAAFSIAIDLPSGIVTDDGRLLGEVPRFDLTLALGAWKPAHFMMPALERLGETKLVEIGIRAGRGASERFPRPRFAEPARGAHKYSRGLIGVIGGAMPGAALLAASAAMRGGAGYVKLLALRQNRAAPASLVIDDRAIEDALDDPRWSALLVGPGLGRDDAASQKLTAVLEARVPTVLDADALHLLDDEALEGVDASRILITPHEGELSRLCATFGIAAVGKVERVRALSGRTGMTILAKGPDTVLAGSDGRTAFFPSATAWLASAGSGDVLAGLAASRLGSGSDPFAAAGEAVWLHGAAGEIAGPGLIADDLVCALPEAYASFL
jgi:hydroxyethylthiazole kinase-like uncharacterized protein yjeF